MSDTQIARYALIGRHLMVRISKRMWYHWYVSGGRGLIVLNPSGIHKLVFWV